MKHLYTLVLFLIFGCFVFSQNGYVQLELVDPDIGFPTILSPDDLSNDDGLNQIFVIHNVIFYGNMSPEVQLGEPYDSQPYFNRLTCDGCNVEDLISDLLAYEAVIAFAIEESEYGYLANFTGLSVVDEAIGLPNGINENGIAITNDVGLNTIFEDFNVRFYKATSSPFYNFDFVTICDCDADLLKSELDTYNTVVQLTSTVFYGQLLSVSEQEKLSATIQPNPFKDKVSIKINNTIENIVLFDALGKQVYKSKSITDFLDFSVSLNVGVYLLKLTVQNGETITKKIVKS